MLKKHLLVPTCLMVTGLITVTPIQAQFSTTFPANPVVLRVGDGTNALAGGAARPVQIQSYIGNSTLQASPTSFVDFNTSGPNRLTISGSATSEGILTNSIDQSLIVLSGYSADAGTANVATASGVNRLSATVQVTGINQISNPTINLSQPDTATTGAYSGNNIRSATTDNGTNFWTGGTAGTGQGATAGVRHFNSNSQVSGATVTNIRAVDIYANQLFATSGSAGGIGVNLIGNGLPTSAPGSLTSYINTNGSGTGTASPYEFVLTFTDRTGVSVVLDSLGLGVAYIADDRSSANGGGIQKWAWNGSAWTLQYTFNTIITPGDLAGARGLSGYFDSILGANVLYVTNAAANGLFEIVDTGSTATFTQLATAGTNFAFRGVALVAVPEPTTYALITMTGIVGAGVWFQRHRKLQAVRFARV